MTRKRKQYLFNDAIPLTNYAWTKIRRKKFDTEHVAAHEEVHNLVMDNNENHDNDITVNPVEPNDVERCYVTNDTGADANEELYKISNVSLHDDPLMKLVNSDIINQEERLELNMPIYHSLNSIDSQPLDIASNEYNADEALCNLSTVTLDESSYNLLNENHEVAMIEDLYSSDEDDVLEHLKSTSNRRPNNINDLKEKEGFFESLLTSVDKSPGELLLMGLKFSLDYKLSFTGTTKLLEMINNICGDKIIPETRYMINQLCNSNDNITLHAVCPECSKYIGEFKELQNIHNCEICNENIDGTKPSDPCYFAIFDPSDAVRDYLQTYEDYYDFVIKYRVHKTNHIKDIYDGMLYRNFVRSLPACDRRAYVTVMFNTDGAPVFESSNVSIWPIYLIINEIPVQARFDSVIVAGLWFGTSKPEMNSFLEVFVKATNELSKAGIKCTINKEIRNIKLYALLASVDTIARAPMNGSSQFNAHYGCDWCEHAGEHFGGSMRYPYLIPPSADRDVDTTAAYAKEALSKGKPVFGIKTASPLLLLRGFDIIRGFTPEYMHCFLAGVAQQYTEYLLESLSKNDIDYIDLLIKELRVPHQLSRLSRPLKERANWKAREWENWVLYYSVPILNTVIKDKKLLKHWALLTESLHKCLQTDITYLDLNSINEMLNTFVLNAENYYTLTALTYNVHQLLHIAESIYDWGPLWAHSAFAFESANHKLLSSIHCAKGVIQQIIRYINMQRSVQILEQIVYPNCSPIVQQYCESIKSNQTKKAFKLSNITYFGNGKVIEQNLIEKLNVENTAKIFSKIVMKGCLFMSSAKLNTRSCNYFAQLRNGDFIKIVNFVVDFDHENELTACQVIKVRPNKYANAVKEVVRISQEIISIQTKKILRGSVFIETPNKDFIIPVPNLFFY